MLKDEFVERQLVDFYESQVHLNYLFPLISLMDGLKMN